MSGWTPRPKGQGGEENCWVGHPALRGRVEKRTVGLDTPQRGRVEKRIVGFDTPP